LILDTPSRDSDEELARHVTYVHINNVHPEPQGGGLIFAPNEVRQWVARARSFRPVVTKQVMDYLVGAYVRLRQQQKRDEASKKTFTHTSPRTLLGILRLSQALARLRFADEVITDDVDEALRLVEVSKASLYDDDRDRRGDQSASTKIFNLVRGMRDSGAAATGEGRGELDLRRVRERVLAKGFTVQQLEACLDEYSSLDVSCVPCTVIEAEGRVLTCIAFRSGRRLARVPGWCSSRQVMMMRTWMMSIPDQPLDLRCGAAAAWVHDWSTMGRRRSIWFDSWESRSNRMQRHRGLWWVSACAEVR